MIRTAACLIAALFSAAPALAGEDCRERQTVVDYLATEYREAPVAKGIANNGGTVEVLANKDGGSWTILITSADGLSCMVAAGDDWQTLPALPLMLSQAGPDA